MPSAYLLLGSNINKKENMPKALHLLSRYVKIIKTSSIHTTSPIGKTDQADFDNCAVKIETTLSAEDLKWTVLRTIESELGRVRTTDPNDARTIDIDIIYYNNTLLDKDYHTYPHVYEPINELLDDTMI